ncbi:tetracycline resistance protein, class D-like [Cotesia glomerata]|uniref:tetracycline resistance protein, class D-like n=1 Tax=Cotesia glomerata TaxID=32391 RepID=UPI001D00AB10|nr:tetracycline resistance protein, class D-like [Cotesia glomerata]
MNNNNVLMVKNNRKHFLLIQPAIFTIAFVNGITVNVLTDMIIFQTCKQILTSNKNNCDIIHTNGESEDTRELIKMVQVHASSIIISKSLIESILPSFFILFLGPWSDKFGRKPLLVGGSFAPMCNHVILSILSVWNENPWVSLIAYIPSALLGSGQTLAAYCYASDISESDKRPLYMASMGGCLSAGLVVGTLTGPLIFQKLNYTFLYKWESPFSWSLLKELIVACTKKGDGSSRKLLWSFLSIFSFYTIINNGTITINYLFANARFGWSKIEFSTYYGSATIVTIVGTIIGLEIMKNRTDVNDFAKILVGSLSGFAAAVTFSFTWKPWHIYLGSVLGILTGVIVPISRSAISKSVLSDDLGKVFSVVSFIETILPLGSAPLYTLVYSSYIADYPTPVFLLSTIMYFFMVVIAGVMNSRFIRYHNSEQ